MHNKYYFLVASLPWLKFGNDPPISGSDFISECKKWLSPEELQVILSADIHHPETGSEDAELLREWKGFDTNFKKELVRIRKARKKKESYKAPEMLKNVMEQDNPLLMERALEKTRWDFLEGKFLQYHFDINWLVLYALKLQILERLAIFAKDKGEEFFYKFCEVKYEQANR